MELHIVHHTIGGYAREDRSETNVIGVYSDASLANMVSLASHAKTTTVQLNHIPPGILKSMEMLGMTNFN